MCWCWLFGAVLSLCSELVAASLPCRHPAVSAEVAAHSRPVCARAGHCCHAAIGQQDRLVLSVRSGQ